MGILHLEAGESRTHVDRAVGPVPLHHAANVSASCRLLVWREVSPPESL